MAKAIDQGRATRPQFEEDATVGFISRRLSGGPQVVHVLAHGFDTSVALQDDDGRTSPMDIRHFAPLLTTSPALRLVFLSSCRTARSSEANRFMPLASRLAEAGVPAVIGMGHSISFGDNRKLLTNFYEAFVLAGTSVAQALLNARKELFAASIGRGSWSIPVLYAAGPEAVHLTVRPGGPGPESLTTHMLTGLPYVGERFVGRRKDLRELRRFMLGRDGNRIAVVKGISGIRKSALVRQCIEKVKPDLAGSLTHPFDPGRPDPVESFLESAGEWLERLGALDLARKVQDPDLDAGRRVRAFMEAVGNRDVVLVMDSFEHVLEGEQVPGPFDTVFTAFLGEKLRAKLVVTTNTAFEVPNAERLGASGATAELNLSELEGEERYEYLDLLPNLRTLSRAQRDAVLRAVGGAPMWLNSLDSQVGNLSTMPSAIDAAAIVRAIDKTRPAQMVKNLDPGVRKGLARFSVFRRPVDAMALGVAGLAEEQVEAARGSFILNRDPDTKLYFTHQLVKTALRDELTEAEKRRTHLAAGAYYESYLFPEMTKRLGRLQELGVSGVMETLALVPGGRPVNLHIEACVHYLLARDYKGAGRLIEQMRSHLTESGRSKELFVLLEAVPEHRTRRRPEIVRLRADLHARWGRWDKANVLYAKLLDSQRKALERKPGDAGRVSNLATTENNLGNLLLRQGRLEEAAKHYEEALRAYKQLLSRDPESVTYQSDVAGTENNLGNLLLWQGRLEEAAKHYEESLVLYGGLYGRDPGNSLIGRHLATATLNFARLRIRAGKTSDGVEGIKQSALLFLRTGWLQGVGNALEELASLAGNEHAEPAATEAALAFAANTPEAARRAAVEKLAQLPPGASPTARVILRLLRGALEAKGARDQAIHLLDADPDALAPLQDFIRSILAGKEPRPEDISPWEQLLRLHLTMMLAQRVSGSDSHDG